MSVVVEVANLTKRYGDVLALDRVSWTVNAGEVVVLLGPNGAGKTTASDIMVGLRRVTAGTVRVFGLEPGNLEVCRKRGVMLQDCEPIENLRVREAIDLFRTYYPTPLPTDTLLKLAAMEPLAGQRADTLSHGQKKRLFFAQAIAGDPELLFLDEPSVGMDVEIRRHFHVFLRSLKERGRTVFLTTHFLEEADALADRVIVLNHGRVLYDTTPSGLKRTVGPRRSWIRFRMPAGLPIELSTFPGVIQRRDADSEVSLQTADPGRLVSELVRAGVPLDNLVVEAPTLEDAFLAAIREEP
jgi:ABC-2 type transport system ATP-binding protein